MNYKIITDEQAFREFIEWLPELGKDETYYYCLFARNKYDSTNTLKADKQQLKRGTSDKEYLFDKIKQLEVEIGCYKQKGTPVPVESLALYISPNPRSFVKATVKATKKFIDLILNKEYTGYNPNAEVLSAIQTSCGKKVFYDFDFDGFRYHEMKEQISTCVNPECLNIVETRGGFHILIEFSKLSKEYKRNWYNNIISLRGVDVRTSFDPNKDGDDNSKEDSGIMPVPGCCQGLYTPILHKAI